MAEKAGVHAKIQESKQKCSNSCKQNTSYSSTVSPDDRILQLQRTAGNQAVQRLIKSRALQAKLKIGQPNDIYEQEADRIAEHIMRTPDPALQRKCPKCDEDEGKFLQAKESSGRLPVTKDWEMPSIVHEVLSSPGQPLNSATRAFMEPRFGHDFSHVRVHTGPAAGQSARDVNANAYTVGHKIVFGTSHYQLNTDAGRRLLAHELVHVVQQDSSHAPAALQRQVRTRWRYSYSKEIANNKIKAVQSLGKSKLLNLEGTIEVDPILVSEGKEYTFFYFPLTKDEAEAKKSTAEAKLGKKDIFTVEYSDFAKSFFIRPKCPDAAPEEVGWTKWPSLVGGRFRSCFKTGAEAKTQVEKFKDAHIEAKIGGPLHEEDGLAQTGKEQKLDRFYFLFQPLTEPAARAKGEVEAKTHGGFTEGMFTVKTKLEPELQSYVYQLEVSCPKGFKSLGKFKITSYFIADESQFPEQPVEKDPCGLKGTFREQFLHKTKGVAPLGVDMEGSGRTLSGKIINVAGTKRIKKGSKEEEVNCYMEVPHALGKDNRPLTVGSSVAVDKKVIPIGTQLLIEDLGPRTADDVGGKIKGKDIDEYKGPYDKKKDTTLENKLVCQKEKEEP